MALWKGGPPQGSLPVGGDHVTSLCLCMFTMVLTISGSGHWLTARWRCGEIDWGSTMALPRLLAAL